MFEKFHRGDIYSADLSPGIGSEQSGSRPVLAHARVMYMFCRVFSCQRSAKEKLLLDSHDKNRRF